MCVDLNSYLVEKKAQEQRLALYTELIQKNTLEESAEIVRKLVEERRRQKKTQQDIANITGIQPPNLARFEKGTSIPTLLVLQKYANALGKHIELQICDDSIET